MKGPARLWEEQEYRERRLAPLIELRLIRRTQPAKRVVKHLQRQMRQLRTFHRMMKETS